MKRKYVALVGVAAIYLGASLSSGALAQTTYPHTLGPKPKAAPIATTTYGKVRGLVGDGDLLSYKGMRYGAPTGGDNRFLPAKPPVSWSGVRDASNYGPICPQPSVFNQPPSTNMSEDCLMLNVQTPALSGSRPVLVSFHGGGWSLGSGAGMSTEFVRRGDVVVVGVNHRINVFGFLALDESFGPEYASSVNVGMLDLAAALKWVKDNIKNFGGDPNNVTVLGVSGGGAKVTYSLGMPAFDGLYQRAVVISGHDLWKRNSMESARKRGRAILAELGIANGDIEALRAAPMPAILHAYSTFSNNTPQDPSWGPPAFVYHDALAPAPDGKTLLEHPIDAVAHGASAKVSLMAGMAHLDHWEVRMGVPANYGWMSFDDLKKTAQPYLGERTDEIIATYRKAKPGASASALLAEIMTDHDWWLLHTQLVEGKATAGGTPAYMYRDNMDPGSTPIGLLMGSETGQPRAVVGQASQSVMNFMKTGNPNGEGIPTWRPYTPKSRNVMIFDYESRVAVDPWSAERMVWKGKR